MIAILAVGVALGGVLVTSLHGLRGELRDMRGDLRTLDGRVGGLEQRVARIQGLIEGLFRPSEAVVPTGD